MRQKVLEFSAVHREPRMQMINQIIHQLKVKQDNKLVNSTC